MVRQTGSNKVAYEGIGMYGLSDLSGLSMLTTDSQKIFVIEFGKKIFFNFLRRPCRIFLKVRPDPGNEKRREPPEQ